ncbi:SDR family NAD(P)-dependent oxidoreductase [Orrella marina]|uniref:Short-chain dehydrogenase n=1 Tax=Orrella marina TaxID=2163011 RepID=A0A2R4XKW0_9BURK|nr:SDR family NAD(P)-dependent oxidoreductase [Orrella marina]AWB34339.1 short-chain dehydrogenase [Orrella marina]
MKSLPNGYNALIIGSTGEIGSAFAEYLEKDPGCSNLVRLSRNSTPPLDYNDESSIADAARQLRSQAPFHLILIATGMLHQANQLPEKRLSGLTAQQMADNFRINTIGPALTIAQFSPLLARDSRSLMGVLSAKIGSIGDNRLGGWYSYRASKAALNMVVRTAAIELARTHPMAALVALHPGTVNSRLSAPFRGAEIGRPATDAASDLLSVLDQLSSDNSGTFWSYNGEQLPW